MTEKHFNAILAKNEIARAIRDGSINDRTEQAVACLRDIESYIGEANQPSVDEIINDEKGWL